MVSRKSAFSYFLSFLCDICNQLTAEKETPFWKSAKIAAFQSFSSTFLRPHSKISPSKSNISLNWAAVCCVQCHVGQFITLSQSPCQITHGELLDQKCVNRKCNLPVCGACTCICRDQIPLQWNEGSIIRQVFEDRRLTLYSEYGRLT